MRQFRVGRRLSLGQRTLAAVFVLAGLGLAPPALAQEAEVQSAPDLPTGRLTAPMPPRPMELLLEHRESLGLTAEQLDRLAAIRRRLAAANDPLVNRMLELRREWQQQRRAARRGGNGEDAARLDRIRAAAQPIHTRIQRNNRTAMQAVNRLLTREQRTELRAIVEKRRKLDAASPAADESLDAGGHR
jgi:hypothetical protein